jgi:hypothetical protein
VKVGHCQAPNKRNPLQRCNGFFSVCKKVKILAISRQLSAAQRQPVLSSVG